MTNKTSPEKWAQNFLKDHMSGEQIYEMYEKWCKENQIKPVRHTVFFLMICQHFGILK